MAITRDKKQALVAELSELLSTSKMTALAKYEGLSVADLQTLRRAAREKGVAIKVVKNRLVKVAMQQTEHLKNTESELLKDQLLYATSTEDEVTPAKVLAEFAKTHDALQLVGGLSAEGNVLGADEIKSLAQLPGKDELIAQVIATLASPVNDVISGLSGNLHGLLDGIEAKATS